MNKAKSNKTRCNKARSMDFNPGSHMDGRNPIIGALTAASLFLHWQDAGIRNQDLNLGVLIQCANVLTGRLNANFSLDW